jgi:hypothetical protein
LDQSEPILCQIRPSPAGYIQEKFGIFLSGLLISTVGLSSWPLDEDWRLEQLKNLADDRLIVGCIYCGGKDATREHVPSRVFLDAPLPENLSVVGACRSCNNGFSLDEEYVACLVESVIAGSADPEDIKRPNVANILRRTPALRAKIEAAKSCIDGETQFSIELERVKNVVVKLARGHAAFELSQPCKNEPASVWWGPLALMDEKQREEFESSHVVEGYGEIGSRGMQRLLVAQFTLQSQSGETKAVGLLINDWVEVQEGRYRYHAIDYGDAVKIKLVISEYMACEIVWDL